MSNIVKIIPQKVYEKKIFATVKEFFPDLNPRIINGQIILDYKDDETSGRVYCLVDECLKY